MYVMSMCINNVRFFMHVPRMLSLSSVEHGAARSAWKQSGRRDYKNTYSLRRFDGLLTS